MQMQTLVKRRSDGMSENEQLEAKVDCQQKKLKDIKDDLNS